MTIITFPSSPSLYQTYTVGSKTWIWNGYAWDIQNYNTAPIFTQANLAYNTANSAASFANSAFTVANNANAIYASGGTIAGPVSITNTTGSTTYSSGALVVTGGVGIGQNLNVYGNTILSGSLTVLGPEVIASSSVTTYQNPYISLHTPATGYLLSDDGTDIGIDFEYYNTVSVAPRVILSGSANGTIATINVSDSSYFAPNTSVIISGVSPSNFNGTFNVLTATPGQLTYALAYTGTINTSGQLGTLYRITNLNITGGSTANGSKISTVTFTPAITVPVGATVTIASCTPTGYNGTWTVTSSSAGSISYHNNSNLSNITANGYITLDNRRAFFGRADDTGAFEFYRTGTWSPAGQFEGIYGTIKASRFWANPSQGSPAADILNGFFTIQNESIYDTTSVANVVNGQVATANLGILTVGSVNTNVTYAGASTLRIQGPPVAGNNVNFSNLSGLSGGGVYALQIDTGDSFIAGNVWISNVSGSNRGIIFPDGSKQVSNAATYTYSTSGYAQANAAFATANNALPNTSSLITVNGSSQVLIANTTASTSNTTGALVVSGGAGIAGNLNVGGATSSFSGSVGVGIANALSKFSIVPGGVENTPTSDVMLHLNGDATYRRLQIDSNSVSGPVIMGRQAGGTPGALANTTSGSTLLYIDAAGYAVGGPGAGGYNNFSASMRFLAAEDFTTANAGSYISWSLTNTGTTSIYEAMRLYNGNLGVGASVGIPSANLTVAGSTSIQNTSNTASYGTTIIQATTATTAQTAIDTWSTSAYRSAKYMVQMTQGSNYHVIELKLLHDGTTVFLTQYGEITTGVNLGTFDATISGSTLSLFINPTSSTSMTINLVREAISI